MAQTHYGQLPIWRDATRLLVVPPNPLPQGEGERHNSLFRKTPSPLAGEGRGGGRKRSSVRLIPRWQPLSVSSLVSQWRYFHRQGPGIVLMRVGRQVEVYGEDALRLRRLLGLRLDERRRPGLGPCIALPPRAVPKLLARLVRAGVGYRYVVEEGYLKGGLKRRVLAAVYACPLETGIVSPLCKRGAGGDFDPNQSM